MLYKLIYGRWLDFALVALGIYAVFATVMLMLRATIGQSGVSAVSIAVLITTVILLMAYSLRHKLTPIIDHAYWQSNAMPLWSIVLLGLALRAAWIIAFPASPGSDGQVYLALGERLANLESYDVAGTLAYWPVGYPLYLAVWLAAIPDQQTAIIASNAFIYFLGVFGTYRVACALGINGNFAALLFALWPNLVFQSGTPEKEMLIVGLLPWATYFLIRSIQLQHVGTSAFVAGIVIGATTLVQPSLQFLALLLPLVLIASADRWRLGLASAALLFLGATLVVAPWTLRNFHVLGDFVLVSTNGGSNFYRANNPLATGGYTPKGEVDLDHLGELESDRAGKALGVQWIRENPADFAALALEKQIRFLGDDAVGVYTTLKVGGASSNSAIYAAIKALSNAWWVAAWVTLLILILRGRRVAAILPPLSLLPSWLWLYLFALHTVFESAGKYHVPALWALCILLALYASACSKKDPSLDYD